jgi:hypothetical protein
MDLGHGDGEKMPKRDQTPLSELRREALAALAMLLIVGFGALVVVTVLGLER